MNLETESPIAFAGTSSPERTPPDAWNLYCAAARRIALLGGVLRCGARQGADQIAVEHALGVGGHVELFLPWAAYERDWVGRMAAAHPGRVTQKVLDTRREEGPVRSAMVLSDGRPLSTAELAERSRFFACFEGCRQLIALPAGERTDKGLIGPEGRDWWTFFRRSTPLEKPFPCGVRDAMRVAETLELEMLDLELPTARELLRDWLHLTESRVRGTHCKPPCIRP